ncbi:MAG: tyrosine 2,3-aminomutase, partial [Candidatus Magasanikbacteria bacterium CG10_big_fil_rev_8_21_14_0_10_47_10]
DSWVADEKIIYGVTTGFGPMVSTLIPSKYQTDLQENLIRSHSTNVGPVFSAEEVRAAMLLRMNAFAKGYSAIRVDVANLLVSMLNHGIHPQVPQWGSVGASGDLTPSAHIALAIMGEGTVEYQGEVMPSADAFERTGLTPVRFVAKEGLALINGTTMMTGVGSLQVHDAWTLLKSAEIISALSIEALRGSLEPFHPKGHELKPHPGQIQTARNLRDLLEGSKLVWNAEMLNKIQEELRATMKTNGDVTDTGLQIQNAYSLRATPQVIGAVRDALAYITARVETEMNSSNDNPLIFPDLDISYQGANFHGQTLSLPMDVLSISLTQIGIISERRLNRMLDAGRSGGLSPFLARGKSGLRCGFEGAQYIPTSLIAECRTLCNPASIQSIPSNAENQDVVSMGLIAARKARDIKERISYVLAVELLAACEAFEERGISQVGPISEQVYRIVRELVPTFSVDRPMTADIEKIKNMILEGRIVDPVETTLQRSL